MSISSQPPRAARVPLVVPIVLMVVSLLGATGTVMYSFLEQPSFPRGGGRMGEAPPSAFPTDGTQPQRDGRPTAVPTDIPTDGSFPNGGPGGDGFGGRGGRLGAGSVNLSAVEIGIISGCGVLFAASLVYLIVALRSRRKGATADFRPPLPTAGGEPSQSEDPPVRG